MSSFTVVTRIIPVASASRDESNLLSPNDVGKPFDVRRSTVTDPRTGAKYNIETTFCIAKTNSVEELEDTLVPLHDSKSAVRHVDGSEIKNVAFSVPKILTKDVMPINSIPRLKESEKDHPSIKLHLNLKKIREATKLSLSKKKQKLVQPLIKYCVNNECLLCGDFPKNEIATHMTLHIKSGKYACRICENKCFSTADALFKHSISHAEKNYRCDKCDEKFKRKYFLSEHYETDHQDFLKPTSNTANLIKMKVPTCFICNFCKVKLTSWKSLLGHKKVHSGDENYLCSFCKKSFLTSCLLRYHSHVRLISKRYSCKTCHKAFSTIQKLQVHEKMHVRKIKYECKKCYKKFNFKKSLSEHIILIHS